MMYQTGPPQGQSLSPLERQQYTLYGAAGLSQARKNLNSISKAAVVESRVRKPLRADCVLICLLTPISQFATVTASLSFSLHYFYPALAWIIVAVCAFFTLACGFLAVKTVRNFWNGDLGRRPFWYVFLAFTMLIAFGFGAFLGEMSWYDNELPAREIRELSSASMVNVANTSGIQFMDVGRIDFLNGTRIDTAKSMYFKNFDTYCVAPITIGNGDLESYDFWSIGLNCCGDGAFRCGEYNNANARSGLRLMRHDQRDYYLLALQQAEAAYKLKSENPLFFYWMQDPIVNLDAYQEVSKRHFGLGVLAFAGFQLTLVAAGIVVFTKM